MEPERWKKIGEIYHLALEIESGQQEGFLKEACAGDESLLKEVKSLLAYHADSKGPFGTPAIEFVAKVLAEDEALDPQPDLTSRTLLHYRITRRSGKAEWGSSTKRATRISIDPSPSKFCLPKQWLIRSANGVSSRRPRLRRP